MYLIIQTVGGIRLIITKMSAFSKETYEKMYDLLLSEELCYESSAATESTIKRAIKLVLGRTIKQRVIKSYSGLVLSESLDVYFSMIDADGTPFDITLYYGQ